jgi:hypothetical protein
MLSSNSMSETKKHTLWFDPISQLDGTGLDSARTDIPRLGAAARPATRRISSRSIPLLPKLLSLQHNIGFTCVDGIYPLLPADIGCKFPLCAPTLDITRSFISDCIPRYMTSASRGASDCLPAFSSWSWRKEDSFTNFVRLSISTKMSANLGRSGGVSRDWS